MRKSLFVSLTILFITASCSPRILSPTVINTSFPAGQFHLTPTQTSTPKLSSTAIPPSSETPSQEGKHAFHIVASPNGEFVAKAYFEYDHPSGKQTIEIQDQEGNLISQIHYQGDLPSGAPKPVLDIFQWSSDSSQLYFYYAWSPDGGDQAFWWTGYDLQKLDIKSGNIQPVLPGKGFMSFAISPDGTRIAYTREEDNPSVVYVRNLSTDELKTAYVIYPSKSYIRVGDIHWSPTGKVLVFQTESTDHMVQTIYLDISTMRQRILKEYKLFTAWLEGWSDDGRLRYLDFSQGGIILMDANTGAISVIGTPTPGP